MRAHLLRDKENCPDIIPSLKQLTNRKQYLYCGGNFEDTFAHFAQLEIDNPIPSDPLGEGKHTPFVLYLDPQPEDFMLIISTPALLYNAVHQARPSTSCSTYRRMHGSARRWHIFAAAATTTCTSSASMRSRSAS